jgi:hypothetical protein
MQEFGFGAGDEGLSSRGSRFKGKEGETYRVSFVWWEGLDTGKPELDAETPKFIGCKRLYLAGVGYFQDKGPEYVKLAGSQSKFNIATIICVWPTDSHGALDKKRFADGDFKVQSWVFGQDKYRNIGQNHSEFPLGKHDLSLSCTDTQYQKMTISPCRESLFRKLFEAGKAGAIIAQAAEMAQNLPNDLAQDLSLDEIRSKLGKGGPSPVAGSGRAAASSPEFDNMLDDILK